MASQCKRQQCTIDRRGFRQELDSWRHKLIHCVGFESILEGLFDPELVEDLKLFKDFKPVAVSDWSFDENCLFCCLRRDKVKEHLIGLRKEVLEDSPKPLLVKDQTTISRLEKQAEEFLNAVLYRKDVPNFSDPHIPVVAREILQRMIRQFAAEYTSKTSSPQDSCSDTLPHSDQSLPTSPLLSGDLTSASPVVTLAGPAHNQNPVLSKLLMADQDAPLDLTIKKPPAEPREQDGVLDLSIKKNRNSSSSLPVHGSCLSPAASMLKGLSLRADGQVGLLMRSLQNGRRRENIGHSSPYKPSSSLAYSLHIKEEANLESDPESPLDHNHSSRPTDLFRNGSTSWNSKTHFGALLKLKAVSEASEHLTDIPKLLEAAGLLTKSLAYEKEKLHEACSDHIISLSHSPSFDLKIPQVRSLAAGTDPSWDPLSTEYSGSPCENGLGKKLHSMLPRQLQKKSNRGFSSGSEKEYCPYITDHQALGGNYHLDSEADLGNKQPRKKRGRYRQYNTELLEEAIVVVIGGKMSVSKAQSIYGIPHSTLEYKVKERLGTLKHPPKKKLKLIGPVEERDGSQCSEKKELQISQQDGLEKKESAYDENGNHSRDGSLSSNEESPDFRAAKAKDLQSTSTLEQFMAKLCPHHQRQIVDAIGFLQTEVKALASSSTQQAFNSTSGIQSSACSPAVTTEKSSESTPKSEVQDMSLSIPSSCSIKKVQENAVSLKTSVTTGPALDLCNPRPGSNSALLSATTNPLETEDTRHGDHAPLKMKIMASNVAAGKKLSCVLNATLSSHSDTSEDRQGHSTSSSRTETHSARLSSSVKRHNQVTHMHQARQRETLGNAKDTPAKLFSVHTSSPSDSQRTARKTPRASSDHRTRDSACSRMDPDLGHCDIVFIDKPITECFKEQQRNILRRRNARKSTRGHIYSDEIWELKTVRTLAGRGNCPNPMPELITLVTPKQILSKPEGVPPVDMPFVGSCRESMNQQMSTEESDENVMPGAGDVVELADGEVDVVVETSQTDQCQSKGQSTSPSTENKETNLEQDITADSGTIKGSDETVTLHLQSPSDTDKNSEPEPQEYVSDSTMRTEAKLTAECLENTTIEGAETEVSIDILCTSDPAVQQNRSPLPMSQADEEMEKKELEETQSEQHQDFEPETPLKFNNSKLTEEPIKDLVPEPILKDLEMETSGTAESVIPLKTNDDNDNDSDYDVSSKTLDALLKELPPWRRKRGTVISLPKRLKQRESVIVGYVNGRPISASDRSLRRRSTNSSGSNKTPVKAGQNVASKTSAIDSTVENKHLEKCLPETCISVHSSEAAVAIKQGTDPSSDTALSPITKVPLKTKQMHTQKRIQHAQDILPFISDQPADGPHSTESKWQLRSASQRPGTPQSLPTSVTSNSSPKPTGVQSTDELLPFSLPSSDPGTLLPLISSSPLVAPQLSQENSVPETPMELKTEKSQQVEATSEEIQPNELQSKSLARQKLRSAKVAVDDHQNDIQLLRSKRVVRKDTEACDVALPQKLNVSSLEDTSTNDDLCNSDVLEKPTRMPLRSESSKADMFHQYVTQPPQLDTKKLSLRSQTLVAPSTSTLIVSGRQSDAAPCIRIMPERISKTQVKSAPLSGAPVLPHNSCVPAITTRTEPPKQPINKFFGALTGEENQHLITNLNMKYDKMQKGWVQMDKEGQPATRYKNKADRQAAIWKSKRRARKPKSLEHQKFSPVQMLFMKGFNLTNICRWFLESTETKSLVIVKKVNTRLPSETQLCFHSSSSATGTSQGVFPSLQAERLKKHLKKFAIASPVKSNPKSQKLIARALEQEANPVKGKERREPPSTTQTLTKSHCSAKARAQICESQKSSGRSKNPASARILRKYSNIRGKLQVQQTNAGMKKAAKTLKANSMKKIATTKSATKSELKPSLKAQKSPVAVSKQMKESAAKMERRKKLASKRTGKHSIQERIANVYNISRVSRDETKKMPKRSSQRLGSPKISECNIVDTSKSKIDNKKPSEAEKAVVEKAAVNKMHAVKVHSKESLNSTFAEIRVTENTTEIPQQSTDLKSLTSPDQVLTRSQRKIETAVPLKGSPSHALKRATKFMTTQKSTKKARETMLTRKCAFKSAKRSQAALLPRSATKSASKRARELLETPAKRTRTSVSK